MRPATDRFRAAVRMGHQVITTVDVLADNDIVALAGDGLGAVTAGVATFDSTAEHRGRVDLTIVDDGTLGLVPNDASSLLAPYGNEVRVGRGIAYADGTSEVVQLGVFGIRKPTITETAGGLVITLSGLDRSKTISDAGIIEPFSIAAGTLIETAIQDLARFALPDLVFVGVGSTLTTPGFHIDENANRWKIIEDMAASAGLTAAFDADGALRLRPIPAGDPVATFAEGEASVLLSASREWDREGTHNWVIASGENTGALPPVRGQAIDDDPSSPTYVYGKFGPVTRRYVSQFLTTVAQCDAAAAGYLERERGTTERVRFAAVTDPTLEPEDVVLLNRPRVGIDAEEHIIDVCPIGLTHDAQMDVSTRARRVLS